MRGNTRGRSVTTRRTDSLGGANLETKGERPLCGGGVKTGGINSKEKGKRGKTYPHSINQPRGSGADNEIYKGRGA